jgi:putative oxidoreductase
MFPQLAQFTDVTLLLLRLMVAAVFIASGWNHARDPKRRARSMGVGPAFATFLGIAEIAGGLGLAFGVLTQLAAVGLILIMLAAIYKKILFGERVSGERSRPGGTTMSCCW